MGVCVCVVWVYVFVCVLCVSVCVCVVWVCMFVGCVWVYVCCVGVYVCKDSCSPLCEQSCCSALYILLSLQVEVSDVLIITDLYLGVKKIDQIARVCMVFGGV